MGSQTTHGTINTTRLEGKCSFTRMLWVNKFERFLSDFEVTGNSRICKGRKPIICSVVFGEKNYGILMCVCARVLIFNRVKSVV